MGDRPLAAWALDRLAARGAYFKDVSGWEGADWYAPPGLPATEDALSWGRQNWFPYWKAEHEATREGVIVMDMSFMSKFWIQGRDAGRLLNHLSGNNVDGAPGFITYTQWLNEGGTLEADLTVTKLDDDRFWLVASDTAHGHVKAWMRKHFPDDAHVFATDVTSGYAQINVQGPRSRELMQSLTSEDLSNEAFPFMSWREATVAGVTSSGLASTVTSALGARAAWRPAFVWRRRRCGRSHAARSSLRRRPAGHRRRRGSSPAPSAGGRGRGATHPTQILSQSSVRRRLRICIRLD